MRALMAHGPYKHNREDKRKPLLGSLVQASCMRTLLLAIEGRVHGIPQCRARVRGHLPIAVGEEESACSVKGWPMMVMTTGRSGRRRRRIPPRLMTACAVTVCMLEDDNIRAHGVEGKRIQEAAVHSFGINKQQPDRVAAVHRQNRRPVDSGDGNAADEPLWVECVVHERPEVFFNMRRLQAANQAAMLPRVLIALNAVMTFLFPLADGQLRIIDYQLAFLSSLFVVASSWVFCVVIVASAGHEDAAPTRGDVDCGVEVVQLRGGARVVRDEGLEGRAHGLDEQRAHPGRRGVTQPGEEWVERLGGHVVAVAYMRPDL